MYPHFAGGSLRHPSCVAAVHQGLQRSIYTVVTYCTISEVFASIFVDAMFKRFTCVCRPAFVPKIIVKIGINTPVFAHINVNAISPHLKLRF